MTKTIKKIREFKIEILRQYLDEAFLKGLNDLGTAKFLIKKGYRKIK